MEINAIIEALKALKEPCEVEIIGDSERHQYADQGLETYEKYRPMGGARCRVGAAYKGDVDVGSGSHRTSR